MNTNNNYWTFVTGVDTTDSATTSNITNISDAYRTTIKYYTSAMYKSKWDEWIMPEYYIPPLTLNKNIKIL